MVINIFVIKGDLYGKIVAVRFFFCWVYILRSETQMHWLIKAFLACVKEILTLSFVAAAVLNCEVGNGSNS